MRLGFEFTDRWLTRRRAIVVTVRRKLRTLPSDQLLPDEIGGVPIDARRCRPARMALLQPDLYASQLRLAPDTGSAPHLAQQTLGAARSTNPYRSGTSATSVSLTT